MDKKCGVFTQWNITQQLKEWNHENPKNMERTRKKNHPEWGISDTERQTCYVLT